MDLSKENAVETILPNAGEQKSSLLASAARRAADVLRAEVPGVGDPLDYLNAYYRHVAAEDLAVVGPERAAAVAVEHARLGAHRPQGRPLVSVRIPAEGEPGDGPVAAF